MDDKLILLCNSTECPKGLTISLFGVFGSSCVQVGSCFAIFVSGVSSIFGVQVGGCFTIFICVVHVVGAQAISDVCCFFASDIV